MSQTETVTLSDLEPVVMDLRATTTILDAMIDANRETHDVSEKEDFAWAKVAGDLSNLTQRVVDMWSAAFHQRHEEITQLKAKHAEEIAALKAEKAAPGSKEEVGRLDAQWRMLAAVAKVATEYCTEAGYKLEPFTP